MDENKIHLSPDIIVNKTFTPNVHGYDSEEVDAFLDIVIQDYQAYAAYALDAQSYIQNLETQVRRLKEELHTTLVDRAKAESRVAGIKDSQGVDATNLQLLRYIARLENALYRLGGDPTKLK